MNVLFLTHRLPFAPNRGDRIRAYHMLRALREHASVEVLSLVHDDDEARQVSLVPAERVRTVRATAWRNKVRSALLLPTSRPLTHVLLDAPQLREVLADCVSAVKPDVVVAYCTGLAWLTMEPELAGIPVVLDMVDVDSEKWRVLGQRTRGPMGWIYAREARCLRDFEIRMMARAHSTLVVAERERATLREMSPEAEVRVVSNGVDLARFASTAPPAPSRDVVFCGVMNYEPNEEAALRLGLRVWPIVRAACPDARLVLLGAHPTARVRDLALQNPSIVVTGPVPEVQPYLWAGAVSVAPIAVARGLQNKVLEALAAGLPVVTTDAVAAGLPECVKGGCVVRESDEEMAAAVIRLLQASPAARRAVASQADLSSFSWEEQMSGLMAILASAAHHAPAAIRIAS